MQIHDFCFPYEIYLLAFHFSESKPTLSGFQTRLSYKPSLESKVRTSDSKIRLSSCTPFQRTYLTAECTQGPPDSTHFSGHLSLSDAQLKHCSEDGAAREEDKQNYFDVCPACSGNFPIWRVSREALNSTFVPSDHEDGQSCLFFVPSDFFFEDHIMEAYLLKKFVICSLQAPNR